MPSICVTKTCIMSQIHFAKSGFSFTYCSVNKDAALKQNIFCTGLCFTVLIRMQNLKELEIKKSSLRNQLDKLAR